MKLRLRSMEARGGGAAGAETHRVDLPPTATLSDVRTLLASKLSAAHPVPAESVRLSLNRREELVSPDPAATLPALGLASGDLVFFALSPLTALAPPPAQQALPRNPSPGSGAAVASVAGAVDRGKGLERPVAGGSSSSSQAQAVAVDRGKGLEQPVAGGSSSSSQAQVVVVNHSFPVAASDPPDVVMEEAFDATKSWSSFVLRDLKRGMANIEGAEGTAAGRLVAALHAALLDAGFVTATQMGSHLSLPQGWPSGALKPLTIKYTIPELSAMSSVAEEGKVVVLNFSLMANFVMVYGYVHGAQSEVCRLCLDLPGLEPLLYLDSDQLSGVHEKGVHDLWRVLKDGICLPLMISLCQMNGFSLPPCLMALPADLKTKVLEFLPGVDLAKVECTCKEMRNLASDDIMWNKLILKYEYYGEGYSGGSKSAKAIFEEFWQANRPQKRPYPTSWNYGWGNSAYGRPLRLPLPTYDSSRLPLPTYDSSRLPLPTYGSSRLPFLPTYDVSRLPFNGNPGSVGRHFGNQRRNISPNCILDGHRHNFL